MEPKQTTPPKSPLSVRQIIVMSIGGFLAVTLIALTLADLFGGPSSSIPLEKVDSEELSFNISMPEGWSQKASSTDSLAVITVTPEDELINDATSVVATHSKIAVERNAFAAQARGEVEELTSRNYQESFNITIDGLSLDSYGSNDDSAFRISYEQTDELSGNKYFVDRFLLHQPDNTVVIVRFLYSDKYPEVAGAIEAIVDSYSLN